MSIYNVDAGITSDNLILNAGDQLFVHSDGIANETFVNADAFAFISKGGTINDTYINQDGEVDLESSATANNTQINTGGYMIVYEKAKADGTLVDGGSLAVYSGGIASNTTVNGPGYLYVFGGGKIAGSTTVNEGGNITLEWGVRSNVDVHGGKMVVKGDTETMDLSELKTFAVDSGGSLIVSASALVSSGTITDGFAKVLYEGTLEKVTLNAATVEVKNGALLSNATMKTGTVVDVQEGGIIRKLNVSKGAVLTGVLREVSELHFDGGTLDLNISTIGPGNATLIGDEAFTYIISSSYECTLTVDASAQATGTYYLIEGATGFDRTITVKTTLGTTIGTISLGGDPLLYGSASYTLELDTTGLLTLTIGTGNVFTGTVADETKMIEADWTALDVNVNANGILNINNGGVASKTTVNDSGLLNINNGGVAYETSVNANGYAYINEGGSANSATVAANGYFTVNENGTAEDVKVLAGGWLYVYAGASVKDIVAEEGAALALTVGTKTYAAGKYAGTAFEINPTTIGFSVLDTLTVTTGGVASNTTVNKDKWLYVESTGLASNTDVKADGIMCVYSGGTAQVTYVSGGLLSVEEDGLAEVINVGDLGQVHVSGGGIASNVVVYQYGNFNVSGGGVAGNVTVNKDGAAYVSEGGLLSGVQINDGAYVTVFTGGTLADLTVSAGASAFVAGKVTGKMTFETGAIVEADTGATFDFDLTSTAPGADALVNDLSLALAQPNFAYTLTVDGTETAGDYKLAEGAAGFDKTITVMNTSGDTLDTITISDGTKTIGGRDYTLTLSTDGLLGVTLGGGGVTPDLTGDLTTEYHLTAGMVGSDVNILNGGFLHVEEDGKTGKTTVNSGGYLEVTKGGSADNVTVNAAGYFYVYSGGTATEIHWTPCEGDVLVFDGGYATFAISYTGVYYGEDGKLLSNTAVMDGKSLDYTRRMLVMNNGTATNTNVTNYGTLDVRSGGTAIDTTVVNGFVSVSSGGIAISTTVGDNSFLIISSGGVASDVTVNADGKLNVFAGGKVTGKMTFETGAVVSAYSKGAILDFDLTQTTAGADALVNDLSLFKSYFVYTLTVDGTEAAGDYKLAEGATGFTKTITVMNTSGDTLDTLSVGTETTIGSRKYTLTLSTGGLLGLTVGDGGAVTPDLTGNLDSSYDLETGKVASDVNILDGGELYVSNGALASQTTIQSNGDLYVYDGGSADVVTVNFGGDLYVSNGGTATQVTENGGYVGVEYGATVEFLPNSFGGYSYEGWDWCTIHSGTTGTDLTAANGGDITVYNGGSAANTAVNDSGSLSVEDGGKADGVNVASGGKLTVYGSATGIVAVDGARLGFAVAPNTYAQGTYAGSAFEVTDTIADYTIHSGGDLYVYKGGTADAVTVEEGGALYVSSGGVATKVKENGGYVAVDDNADVTFVSNTIAGLALENYRSATVHSGTTATDTTLVNGGQLYVYDGGIARNTKANAESYLAVSSGGLATGTTVIDIANLFVYESGMASDTTVKKDGNLHIQEGGAAEGITVEAVGFLYVYDGGKVTGKMTFEAGSYATFYDGAIVDFDLTKTTPGADALVNDLSFVGTAAVNYTLTVSGTEAAGDYKLAEGAEGFDKTITVVNTSGATLGSLTVGTETTIGSQKYTLTLSTGGLLGVTLGGGASDSTDPVVSNVAADITAQTNGNVTVTADFTDDVAVKASLYKFEEDTDWSVYPDGGVVVNHNTTVYFKAVDLSDNESKVESYVVTNIDKVIPTVSNVQADITAQTNGSVTVTATFDDDVEVQYKRYRIGDGEWQDYPDSGVVLTENASVFFLAVDTAGNESSTYGFEVANIDKVDPTITVKPSTTAPAASVTVTAIFDDNVEVASKQYKVGDGAWQDYTDDGVTVDKNTTVSFRAVDTAGNEKVESYAVENITTGGTVITGDVTGTTDITAGNVASDVDIKANGMLYVYAGGVASKTVVEAEGALLVSGGSATETGIDAGGELFIYDGGTADTTTAIGAVYVGAGGKATNTTLQDNGTLILSAGASATGATAEHNGWIRVSGGAVVRDVTVRNGGNLLILGGGKATGMMTFETGAFVSAFDNSIIDFDISSLSPANEALVNDLSLIQGTPKYTLTVDNTQALGTYNLASGAMGFDKTITVQSTLGEAAGTISVDDGAKLFGDVYLTLKQTGSDLTLTISESGGGGEPDTVSPTITVTPSTTAPAASVTLTAVFDDNVAVATKEYKLAGGDWKPYTGAITVTQNVYVSFRATDTSDNVTVQGYDVTNISTTEPVTNEPANDWLYRKKVWNSDANIAQFYPNDVVALAADKTQLIYLDPKGTVDSGNGKYNSVGRTKAGEETVEDASDYAKIELAYGAALQFSVDSEVAGTFYVYEKTKDKKGNDIAKQCQKITVKADKTSPAKLTTIYLAAGEYYVGMEAKLPSARRYPEYGAYYNVQLTGTKYFENADGGWNNGAYAIDAETKKEDKFHLDPTMESKALALGRSVMSGANPGAIKLDDGAAGTDDWVGFTDATDYRMFTLDNAVNLTLSLSVTKSATGYGKAKLTIWKVTRNTKTGKITLASKGSVVVKQDNAGLIKSKFLDKGEYFISVTSMDAKKGGDVSYNVKVDSATLFFDSIDDGKNNELYNKKAKAFYGEDAEDTEHVFENTTVAKGKTEKVKLDTEAAKADGYDNYVGYKDKTDYAKVTLSDGGKLYFKVKATGNCTFTVYKKGEKNGKDTLDAIQTTKFTLEKDKTFVERFTDMLSDLDAGEYYVSMTAANTSSTAKGSVYYNVTATLEASESASLAMPETSDSLAMTDSLSFGSYGADVLADASVSTFADLDDKSAWQNLALA